MEEVISKTMDAHEWGAIILLLVILCFYIKIMVSSNAKREENLVNALLKMSDTIPALTQSVNKLQVWLETNLGAVAEKVSHLSVAQNETLVIVEDHEYRITGLEERVPPPTDRKFAYTNGESDDDNEKEKEGDTEEGSSA